MQLIARGRLYRLLGVGLAAVGIGSGLGGSNAARADSAAVCSWSRVLEVDALISGVDGHIGAVSAASATDVWAGGEDEVRLEGSSTTRSQPLLAHWDGRAWTVTPTPLRWGYVETLVASRGSAWATVSNSAGSFLLHWGGSRWRIMPRPVDVPSPWLVTGPRGRVWLIGKRVYERDGGGWRPLRALGPVAGQPLRTLRASAEIWRVRLPRLPERWDGTRWVSTAPLPRDFQQSVADVVPFSAKEAWMAGYNEIRALVFRWDGSRWRRVPGPPPGATDAEIYTTGARTLWLTGTIGTDRPYLMRLEGSGWKPVPPPTREETHITLHAVGSETWATSGLTDDVFRLSCE